MSASITYSHTRSHPPVRPNLRRVGRFNAADILFEFGRRSPQVVPGLKLGERSKIRDNNALGNTATTQQQTQNMDLLAFTQSAWSGRGEGVVSMDEYSFNGTFACALLIFS